MFASFRLVRDSTPVRIVTVTFELGRIFSGLLTRDRKSHGDMEISLVVRQRNCMSKVKELANQEQSRYIRTVVSEVTGDQGEKVVRFRRGKARETGAEGTEFSLNSVRRAEKTGTGRRRRRRRRLTKEEEEEEEDDDDDDQDGYDRGVPLCRRINSSKIRSVEDIQIFHC
ncbi:hypothetical protein RUM44_000972 [Polyplax serrata]|uniref:Uncharacterized protein n=1 Tax=Polyplax serrata TaxID=468196 RepID=A0ABR1B6G8_POLSC